MHLKMELHAILTLSLCFLLNLWVGTCCTIFKPHLVQHLTCSRSSMFVAEWFLLRVLAPSGHYLQRLWLSQSWGEGVLHSRWRIGMSLSIP